MIIKSESAPVLANSGKAIFEKQFDFVDEVIVAESEICLKLNPLFTQSDLDKLHSLTISSKQSSKTYKLPVYFEDHEDWNNVEKHTGNNRGTVIEKLLKTDFSVAMFGFLPGFIYLAGLDNLLHVPRKTIPSKYVEANTIALGGKYIGIYSVNSPGGWHVLGRIPIPLLDLSSLPPVVMNLGDQIRLEAINESRYQTLLEASINIQKYNS